MSEGLLLGPFDQPALEEWGHRLGSWLVARPTGVFIGLRGDLGAGKSVLARAVAAGAGVRAAMPSPTFNLLFRYTTSTGCSVAHLDLYRMTDPDEVWELGWEELSGGNEIALVEWPERAGRLLPADRWEITLEPVANPEQRVMSVQLFGDAPAFPLDRLGGAPTARHGG